jgi:hypothetical protein
MKKRTIVKINITTFIGAIGAEHYYGSIETLESDVDLFVIAEKHNTYDFKSVKTDDRLLRKIDAKEAAYLNKKDGCTFSRWEDGDKTEKFNSIEEMKEMVFELYPNCDVIFTQDGDIRSIDMDVHQIIKPDTPNKTGKKLRIEGFKGFDPTVFANLTEGSEHDIIETPERFENQELDEGYWVMGIGEPVLVLKSECILI